MLLNFEVVLLRWWGFLLQVSVTVMANFEGFMAACFTTVEPPLQLRQSSDRQFDRMLSKCSAHKSNFDQCLHGVLNELVVYFPTGRYMNKSLHYI